MLFSNCANQIQIRCRSMLRQTEVKALKEVLQAPKTYLNPYTLFYQERFPKVKAQNPNSPVTELGKLIAKEWKTLEPAQKSVFQDKAFSGKEKYLDARTQFEKQLTPAHKHLQTLLRYNKRESPSEEHAKTVRKTLRSFRSAIPEAPSTPLGIYLREKLSGKKIEENASGAVLSAWKNLPSYDKAQYEEKAKKDIESYKSQIRAFLSNPANYQL